MADQRIRELMDRVKLTNLVNEYCRALDQMDLQSVAAVFTPDCLVEYGPEDLFNSHGADGLVRDLGRMWRYTRTSHHLSNVQITLEDEDHARGVSYVMAWHERPDGTTGILYGQYHDKFVRTAQGWRIAHRRLYMNGNDAGFQVKINPFPRTPAPEGWVNPLAK
jgi:ketosteroid isomerase-like protein